MRTIQTILVAALIGLMTVGPTSPAFAGCGSSDCNSDGGGSPPSSSDGSGGH